MKKVFSLLLLASILTLTGAPSTAQPKDAPKTDTQTVEETKQPEHPSKEEMKKQFEQRLNLSDKQKEKAKAIHQQGREEMAPIMVQIKQKHQEIEMVKMSRMAEKMQQEKIAQITAEIQTLEKQAHEIRKKNSQEFEKILNKKQKAELEQMKAEGRARFEKYHKARPAFQGLGTPNMFLKPLLPPPHKEGLWK